LKRKTELVGLSVDRDQKIGFGISLLLHIAFFALILSLNGGGGEGEEDKNGQSKSQGEQGEIIAIESMDYEEFIEKQKQYESEFVVKEEEKKKEEKPEKTIKAEECKNFFGGIGIEHNWMDNSVTKVVPGYPASQNGIMLGDQVVGKGEDIRGEVGTPVILMVKRGAEIFEITVIRGKICLDPIPEAP